MKDEDKPREQLISEITELRQQLGELKSSLETGHKRAEQEVREQLNFLQVLIDTIPMPIYYKDPNEIYLGCNKAFEIMLDQPKENIVGKIAYDIWPKDLTDIYHRMDNDLLSHTGVQVFDSRSGLQTA